MCLGPGDLPLSKYLPTCAICKVLYVLEHKPNLIDSPIKLYFIRVHLCLNLPLGLLRKILIYCIIVIYILIEIEFGERATPNIESKSNCVLLELESSISSNTITSF